MNYISRFCILLFSFFFLVPRTCAVVQEDATNTTVTDRVAKKEKDLDLNAEFIRVNYTDKPVSEAVNEVAALLGINIMMPQDGKGLDKIFYESKLTYHLPEKISLKELWELLLVSLHTLGYMTHQQGDLLAITLYPNAKDAARQPLTLYHDVPPSDLPNTNQIIRYIYHLRNLSLDISKDGIKNILEGVLSKNPSYQFLTQTNAIVITDRAANIKNAMTIIAELDEGGLRDAIEVIPLYYTSAALVDDLFNKQLFLDQSKKGASSKPEEKQIPYFPQNTKVAKLERSNSIVIMGTTRSIDIVKDFIVKYIDRPLETGDSMLHVYDLQYLRATDFAKVLQNIVKGSQKQQTKTAEAQGPQQYFEDVVIIAEISTKEAALTPETQITQVIKDAASSQKDATIQIGGNRLIIAARKNDWVRIKKLIDELDKPQLQVAIEVLILDLTVDHTMFLGGQTRNKSGFNNSTSEAINWQSAQLAQPVLKRDANGNLLPDALMANLLQLVSTTTGSAINIASNSEPGSFIISFKDKDNLGVWSILQMLNTFFKTNILAQPFLVLQNHKPGWVFTQENRYLQSETQGGTGQIARVNFEDVSAGITLDVLPHISETGNVNMQIIIQIGRFLTAAGTNSPNNRSDRVIRTNANVGNGEVLVLGGLTRDEEDVTITESPLLGQVPVLGWFFKSKRKQKVKNHLMVLISPTIVKPYVEGGMDVFTAGKMSDARDSITEDLAFINKRDPITRWFFKPNLDCPYQGLDDYLDQSYYDEDVTPETELGASALEAPSKILKSVAERSRTIDFDAPNSAPLATNSVAKPVTQAQPRENQLKQLMQNEDNPLLVKQRKDQAVLNT
ncbi:MAG: secretin N-terminal domain-containing protein [Candidatus Babeliales bacterium]